MKLSPCVREFFEQYLPNIKGVSHDTVIAYRDAFKLILPYAAKHYGIKIRSLRVEHLSSEFVIPFLDELEKERKNVANTRNHRLAALKSFARMLSLMYPEQRQVGNNILRIPQKRTQKPLIGFLYQDEILQVFEAVDLKKKEGFRDYALLHLLYDSGARATEMATLNLAYFDCQKKTLAILGKGNRFRLIQLKPKTCHLVQLYIKQYRISAKPMYRNRLFLNQRGEELTRHGIYRICRKYLEKALTPKRLRTINPVRSFRHSRAVAMLYSGHPITDIKNHLGHDNIQSTTIYLHLDLNRRQYVQRRFIRHMESVLTDDSKIEEALQWENEEDMLAWLDRLQRGETTTNRPRRSVSQGKLLCCQFHR